MENDLILKNFLKNDNHLNRIESKLSLDYIKCKLDKCYSMPRYTHENYESCKEECLNNLTKFKVMKDLIYKDFTEFYYQKFLECANDLDETKYRKCKQDTLLMQTKNIEEIKRIILNYKFN